MQIIINAPDAISAAVIEQQVKEFEDKLKALSYQPREKKKDINAPEKCLKNQEMIESKPSKWVLFTQEIEKGNYFNDYSEQIKRDAKEVREGFVFASDK